MSGETIKTLGLDGYCSKQMVLIEDKDRNGKTHFYVVEDMEEAKKVSSNNKRLIQVYTKGGV